MAVTQTTGTPTLSVLPWQGVDDVRREYSEIPRAEVRYQTIGGSITDSGVGDTQSLRITCSLPVNFAYVLQDLNFGIYNDGSEATVGFGNAGAQLGDASFNKLLAVFPGTAVQVGPFSGLPYKMYDFNRQNFPSITLVPPVDGTMMQMTVDVYNETENESGYGYYFFARFLRYDISQAYHWAVNTPTLTR